MNVRVINAGFAVLNAILYSSILPLWEGFDEPFHFGYVQYLANGEGLPDAGTTFLSREVASSLLLSPASAPVQHNLPAIKTYSEYFSWPFEERVLMRQRLNRIPLESRWSKSDYLNYEAHHAPLAYALLAVPERAFAGRSLPLRVLILRILASLGGTLLLYSGMSRLFADLRIPHAYNAAACFCVLSCQMTWATIAHVANDWLAVPLTIWSLSMLIRYWQAPAFHAATRVAAFVSIGLLTKAYFLALLPVVLATCFLRKKWKHLALVMVVVLLVAGPWYRRNMVRYGVITGMQEARSGIDSAAVLNTAPLLDWSSVAIGSARSALWTGNNSFTSFSMKTLHATIVIWLGALILWAARRDRQAAEWITGAHCSVFLVALGYITVVSFLYTNGVAGGPSPWYSQVLLAPMLGLAFLGCSRSAGVGRIVAAVLVTLFGYILVATYVAKLIPLYGGYPGRTSLAALAVLYSKDLSMLLNNLDLIALAPATLIISLTFVVTVLAVTQVIVIVRLIYHSVDCSKPR